MEAVFEALNFNVWSFLLQALDLLIVLGVLYLLLHKPLGQLMAQREQKVEATLAEAAAAKDKAESLLAEYQKKLNAARKEAQEIVEQARALSEKTREEILAEAKAQAERTLAEARREIEAEKARALKEIREEAATLAVLAAGKVIERALTDADHERLARQFLSEVGQLQ
ncbi:MAG: F-type H+-transporting ATPase subunit b [Clostridia bacterium]|nr:F-type H+-transporting ATPase subunit b [Clostridia bacterium]